MLKLEHSEAIGRVLRLDDLDTLGVSTQTLAEEAIAHGDWATGARASWTTSTMRCASCTAS